WVIVCIGAWCLGWYLAATYLLGQDWALGWAGAFCFVSLTSLLLRWNVIRAPLKQAQAAVGFPASPNPPLSVTQLAARKTGRRLALAAFGFYILVCSMPFTKSPATFVAFFFFGIAVIYTFLSVYLHRATFAMGIGLLMLLIFSGVAGYHFRFPGLTY